MFDIPGAKRVKRSKLFSSTTSSEDEQENDEDGRTSAAQSRSNPKSKSKHVTGKKSGSTVERDGNPTDMDTDTEQPAIDYGFEYEFVDTAPQSTRPAPPSNPPESQDIPSAADPNHQEQSFEFNLFAPRSKPSTSSPSQQTTTPASQAHKITLRAPSPSPSPSHPPSTGRFLRPRPLSTYLTGHLPPQTLHLLQSQYLSTAISPTTLFRLSQTSWPGCSLPWRTTHITQPQPHSHPINHTLPPASQPNHTDGKRRRPSKKRRIQVRTRQAQRRVLAAQSQAAAEAEREKRTRRNREKKVKRKMRDRAKKAGARGDEQPEEKEGDSE